MPRVWAWLQQAAGLGTDPVPEDTIISPLWDICVRLPWGEGDNLRDKVGDMGRAVQPTWVLQAA